MADFPITTFNAGTTIEFDDGLVIDRATNGLARARNFYTERKLRTTLVLIVDEANRDTLLTFYDNNRLVSIGLDIDGEYYANCFFTGPPRLDPLMGGKYSMTFNVVEV
jgi:hypothetical protein